jgi:hypothetical protein
MFGSSNTGSGYELDIYGSIGGENDFSVSEEKNRKWSRSILSRHENIVLG